VAKSSPMSTMTPPQPLTAVSTGAAGADPPKRLRDAPAWVVHALNGYEAHGDRIRRIFAEQEIPFEFATEGDVSRMDEKLLRRCFTPELLGRFPRTKLSCSLNHMLLYERIVEDGAPYAVVFEDDVCFLTDFRSSLDAIDAEVRALRPGFLVSLENSTLRFPSYWQARRGQQLYRADVGRCAGAYLIDRAAALAMTDEMHTRRADSLIDHWHNTLADRGVIAIYWAHPAPVEQGSHNGVISARESTHRSSPYRRASWLFQRTLRLTLGRLFWQKHLRDPAQP